MSSIETAYAAEHTLLEYMYRRDIPVDSAPPYAKLLSEWEYFAENATTANITLGGFEFGPLSEDTAKRCTYINSLLRDPANGV